jgi:hypothetical protein
MKHPLTLICLTLAFLGPLLVQAEAASDLTRSLANVFDMSNVEPPDGGVGDDPVVAAASRPFVNPAVACWAMPSPDVLPAVPISVPCTSALGVVRLRRGMIPWPFATGSQRNAWLQHFLI